MLMTAILFVEIVDFNYSHFVRKRDIHEKLFPLEANQMGKIMTMLYFAPPSRGGGALSYMGCIGMWQRVWFFSGFGDK